MRSSGGAARAVPAAAVIAARRPTNSRRCAEAGATCVNLRIHVPGVSTEAAREQIAALGHEVLPRLRAAATDPTRDTGTEAARGAGVDPAGAADADAVRDAAPGNDSTTQGVQR
ncbi:hypothetical protein [Embleya sp. NPDC005575]|uniref:hypothetical protein n=1 Tax=Embleya sp. NPDC005575 TaxID=3156892 RepID=UPI00339EA182